MRFTDMSPADRLDYVMSKIKSLPNPNHWRKWDDLVDEIITSETQEELIDNRRQLDLILKKLKKDGYMEDLDQLFNDVIPMYIFNLTFEGEALLQMEGGYSGRLEKESQNSVLERRNEIYLRNGAVGAAVFAGGSLIIQTLDLFHATKSNSVFVLAPLWVISAFFLLRWVFQILDGQ